MADEQRSPKDESSDPRVERLRPAPGARPAQTRELHGFVGPSDREGYRRLYLTRALDAYAEFRAEDVVVQTPVPADQQPYFGEESTRIELSVDAEVDIVRSRRVSELGPFDLDLRFTAAAAPAQNYPFPSYDPWTLKAEPYYRRMETPCPTNLFVPPCNVTFPPTNVTEPIPTSLDDPLCVPKHTDPGYYPDCLPPKYSDPGFFPECGSPGPSDPADPLCDPWRTNRFLTTRNPRRWR